MMRHLALFIGTLSMLVSPTAAEMREIPFWESLDPRVRPPGVSDPSLAYDEARNELILFGGVGSTGEPTGTWVRRADAWVRLDLSVEPPSRYGAAMVYDVARGELVLFGGWRTTDEGTALANDTWTWDGTAWQHQAPANAPTARAFAAATYDRAHGEVLLFGGIAGGEKLGDTWVWDGQNWLRRHPLSAPSPRYGAGLAVSGG